MAQQKRKKNNPRRTSTRSFQKQVNMLFEKDPKVDGDYQEAVRSAYAEYRNGQLNQAMENTYKKLKIKTNPAMSALAGLIFSEKHLGRALAAVTEVVETTKSIDDIGNLAERLSAAGGVYYVTPRFESAVAEYGKAHQLSAEDAVKSPEARLYAVNKAYGSLENYRNSVKQEIKSGLRNFKCMQEVSEHPAMDLPAHIFSYSELPVANQAAKDLIATAKRFSRIGKEHIRDAGMFGQQFVREYANIMVNEVKEYDKLDK